MNVQMGDLRESLMITPIAATAAATGATTPAKKAAPPKATKAAAPAPAPGVVDPMQWWSALTNQFAQLATTALKDSATDTAKTLAGSMLKQSFDTAAAGFKAATSVPVKAATAGAAALGAAASAGKAAARPKRARRSSTASKA
jgi:hypothetical protein